MNFDIITADQRTDEWRLARIGRITGSRACDMLATVKSGEAAARRDLRLQLVCERLTGQPQEDGYVSKDMQRGIDREGDALAAYEAATGVLARQTGFLAHRSLMAGCSPDGYVDGFRGVIELKCPRSATHLRYLRTRKVPPEYLPQVQHALWITGAEWCDFASFDDRFPPALRLFCVRLRREDVDLKAYELLVRMFLAEVDREYAEVASLVGAAA